MRIPESWLRTFVDPALSTAELAHQLTMSGAEVEDVSRGAPPFDGVVVATVKDVSKHPNADKLSVCKVDAGTGELLNIVCGAPNVRAGIKVPCALVGAKLPGDFEIKSAKMRGVDSQGMLCSARELGMSDDHSGLLILPDDAVVGQSLREALDLDDAVLTLKLTPNKADCLSVFGIAREVAAITRAPLKSPHYPAVPPVHADRLPVAIEAADLCGRFSGRIIRKVDGRAPTPQWMKSRLERAGQRPISALVDISNYVMLELGRPSHIFDLDKIAGGLQVRWARAGEQLKLLNGNTIALDADVGVIADAQQVESLAGIMGGDATAVSDDTSNIYVEAAFWWPDAVRGRARRYNFSTDAAHRFERGVDAASTVEHLEYLTRLILDICGGEAGPVDDQITRLPARPPVRMRVNRCRQIIGADIAADEMADIFKRLQLPFERIDDAFVVSPPSFRFDLEIEEDLIEEVARIWGYERLPQRPPQVAAVMRSVPEATRPAHALRRQLSTLGYSEAVNFSFVDAQWERDFCGNDQPIALLNPIASNLAVMRSSLLGSLVDNVVRNVRHRQPRVRMFEIGRVFHRAPNQPDGPLAVQGVAQPMHVAAIAYGPAWPEQWGLKPARAVDFFDIKGDLEQLKLGEPLQFVAGQHPAFHPGRCAQVFVEGRVVGVLGELHPRWVQKYELPQAPVAFELPLDLLCRGRVPAFREMPRQQAVLRDVALVVRNDVSFGRLHEVLSGAAARLGVVRDVQLFDVFRPAQPQPGLSTDEKSCAVRITLRDEQPLTDEAADSAVAALVAAVSNKLGGRLRG